MGDAADDAPAVAASVQAEALVPEPPQAGEAAGAGAGEGAGAWYPASPARLLWWKGEGGEPRLSFQHNLLVRCDPNPDPHPNPRPNPNPDPKPNPNPNPKSGDFPGPGWG